jgi:hypothetical protein
VGATYLAESFRFGVLLETERWEMYARAEDLSFSQNTDTTNAIDFHLHIWVAIWVPQVGQMWSPGGVLCVTFYDDSVFVEGICKCESGFRFLPRVQIVWLLSAKPIGKWSPDI